ncbi:sigma-54-dependent transcriptional regulator [Syntrophomonas palmitatica]|uniref:sigma-54-dependent transcriptional regulator n=1 Tax=Syntrophomonas palmitatica TaxID=402877 RepID=UPI0006D029B6|nr:sigma-54 dependent transcriptional regulator [Syntrophomonas palmitatica]
MNILLVDDEQTNREYLAMFLRRLGHTVIDRENGYAALETLLTAEFHLVLTDNRMPGMSGIDLMRKIHSTPGLADVYVVLFTAYSDQDTAIEALRAGAYDYLLKPIDVNELVILTRRVAEHQSMKRENEILTTRFAAAVDVATRETKAELLTLRKAYSQAIGLNEIVVFSDTMKRVFRQASILHKDRSIPVLIEGETGTGKEVVARYIHYGEGGVTTSFIGLNCASIPHNMFESELFGYEAGAFTGGLPKGNKGKLDLAQEGTLFLDEITEIPAEDQAKLLRVLEEKEYYRVGGLKVIQADVRIICSTNRDILNMVAKRAFREDLYYRLNTGKIIIPPLRERTEEIIPLAEAFLFKFAREKCKRFKTISRDAREVLLSYNWPGNVRELKNTIERAVVMWDDNKLKLHHLDSIQHQNSKAASEAVLNLNESHFILPSQGLPLEQFINRIIRKALDMHNGNKTETARYLGISRSSLVYRLKHMD